MYRDRHRDRAYRASLSSESNRFVTAFCDDGGSGICEFVRSLVCACACVLVGVCCVCVHTSLCAFSLLACARVLVRACACMRASLCEEERVHLCLRACACLSVSHPHMHTLTHMHTCTRAYLSARVLIVFVPRLAVAKLELQTALASHTHTHTHTRARASDCACVIRSSSLPLSLPPSLPPSLPCSLPSPVFTSRPLRKRGAGGNCVRGEKER